MPDRDRRRSFTLARADSGELKANVREVYLDELVADCVRSIRTLADKRDIKIDLALKKLLSEAMRLCSGDCSSIYLITP